MASAPGSGSGIFRVTPLGLWASRETSFHTLEANVGTSHQDSLRFFGGVRALWIGDDLDLRLDAEPAGFPGTTNSHKVEVSNRLVGPQIGAEFQMSLPSMPNFGLFVDGRLGLLHNESSATYGRTLTGVLVGPQPVGNASWSGWTGVAELGVGATVQATEAIAFELRYNLIYVDKVASSTETLGNLDFGTGEGSVGTESVLYHGVHASFVWRFMPN